MADKKKNSGISEHIMLGYFYELKPTGFYFPVIAESLDKIKPRLKNKKPLKKKKKITKAIK